MDTVKVKKSDLLDKLHANRELHKEEFERAVEKHREQTIDALRELLEQVEGGAKIDLTKVTSLPKPVQYLESFDEAIAMLEWEQEDDITLDQQDFQRYVLNKWEWARQFMAATSLYTG